MSSSTLNSKDKAPTAAQGQVLGRSYLVYGLGLVAVFIAMLVLLQIWVVRLMPESADSGARFVVKILTDPRANIVLGDSHVGQRDRMGQDYVFLGRPGTTSFEMRRFAETFYRRKAPGRVIIEAGPQLFAEVRQAEWRSLNKDSLKYQLLPFPVFVLEPEVTKAVGAILNELRKDMVRLRRAFADEAPPEASDEAAMIAAARLAKARAQLLTLEEVQSRLVSFYDLPAEARAAILGERYETQVPSPGFMDTPAWHNFLALLDFLEARGAEVCIIRTPVVAEYRQMIAEEPRGARFSEALGNVAAEAAARGMRYRDFTEIVPGLPGFYYKNQDHLNALGHRVFWPRVEEACFGSAAPDRKSVDGSPLYHKLELENAGFETALERAPACLPGWAWRGRAPLRLASWRRAHVEESPFRSRSSYGIHKAKGGGKTRWWSLGKSFDIDGSGGGPVTVQVQVRSEGLTLPKAAEDGDPGKTLHFGRDDAFVEIEMLDAKGKRIKLSPEQRYSATLSEQAAARGLSQAEARADWQTLSHSFKLHERARVLRIWITATDGGGKRLPRGWKGGRPALLLDDFELMSPVRIEEIAAPKKAKEKAPC